MSTPRSVERREQQPGAPKVGQWYGIIIIIIIIVIVIVIVVIIIIIIIINNNNTNTIAFMFINISLLILGPDVLQKLEIIGRIQKKTILGRLMLLFLLLLTPVEHLLNAMI